jgi:hypothetical protein
MHALSLVFVLPTQKSPLVKKLFASEFVKGVFLGNDFLTVPSFFAVADARA